jgi:hypothetical protein
VNLLHQCFKLVLSLLIIIVMGMRINVAAALLSSLLGSLERAELWALDLHQLFNGYNLLHQLVDLLIVYCLNIRVLQDVNLSDTGWTFLRES